MSLKDPKAPPPSPPAGEARTFEESVARLSEIVSTLEKGDLPLEDSLRLFEEGVMLSRASQQKLDAAQKRVDELLSAGEGRVKTTPFETRGEPEE